MTAAVAQAFRPDADHLVIGGVILAIVAWIAWHDTRTLTIPDGAVIALAIIAVSVRWRLSDVYETVLALLVDGGLPVACF